VGASRRTGRARLTVALVGADGAGKSTVSARLTEVDLPRPVKVVYMGVNLEASSLMLPTTWLLIAAKRARGRRADLTASPLRDLDDAPADAAGGRGSLKETVRLSVWMAEEWLRQVVATSYSLRGRIVVFDRHFFADYYHADVRQGLVRSPVRRLHGWMLRHAYPQPDLTIVLDAPAERLYARKPEATVAWLEARRRQYLDLAAVVPGTVVVDADRPVDAVVADISDLIRTSWKARA
jgi:thymidylate kinase